MEKIPDIKPIKLKEYNIKQSKYDMVGRIPVRQIVLGPSGSGKGIFIQNEILDIYKNLFARICSNLLIFVHTHEFPTHKIQSNSYCPHFSFLFILLL